MYFRIYFSMYLFVGRNSSPSARRRPALSMHRRHRERIRLCLRLIVSTPTPTPMCMLCVIKYKRS